MPRLRMWRPAFRAPCCLCLEPRPAASAASPAAALCLGQRPCGEQPAIDGLTDSSSRSPPPPGAPVLSTRLLSRAGATRPHSLLNFIHQLARPLTPPRSRAQALYSSRLSPARPSPLDSFSVQPLPLAPRRRHSLFRTPTRRGPAPCAWPRAPRRRQLPFQPPPLFKHRLRAASARRTPPAPSP